MSHRRTPTPRTRFALALPIVSLALAAPAAACSGGSDDASGSAGRGAGAGVGTGTAQGGTGTGGDIGFDGGPGDSGLDPDSACAATSAEATLVKKPVDIVFVIDNSGSMGDNIVSVQNNINDNFASIIAASGIDYRVIMLSEHGEAIGPESICVKAPLSATDCNPVPPQPANNPPFFFHYSYPVLSHDSWCRILDTFDGSQPDQYGLAPMGWSEWLRPDSFKVFVEVTDDDVQCSTVTLPQNLSFNDASTQAGGTSAAQAFDAALLAMSPAHFGDAANRNYMWQSIIGLSENNPATAAWQPADPIVLTNCGTAVSPGTGYQALSAMTGGLRFPICQFASFDVVFQAIAEGVIQGAKVECSFPVPDPPPGETIDLSTVVVQYSPGDMSPAQSLQQVASAAECGPGKFYIAAGTIELCPDACALVQSDDAAKISILYGCEIGTTN